MENGVATRYLPYCGPYIKPDRASDLDHSRLYASDRELHLTSSEIRIITSGIRTVYNSSRSPPDDSRYRKQVFVDAIHDAAIHLTAISISVRARRAGFVSGDAYAEPPETNGHSGESSSRAHLIEPKKSGLADSSTQAGVGDVSNGPSVCGVEQR